MLGRRALFGSVLSSSMAALSARAAAKEDLVIGTTQAPGTMNPLISSMLARALIQGMTLRPFTAYDADWKLVCLACTRLPDLKEGTARVIELPDGKQGMEIDVEIRPLVWGDGVPVTTRDVAFTLAVGKHPLSGVASAEGYRRILKLDIKDDRRFTATVDRITFDYDNVGLVVVPAHIEKPIFDADPAEYRNRTAYDTDPTNPGLGFGPYYVSELVPGSRIALRQNAHWKGEPPYFKRITFKFIENNAALEANLLAGNIDYVLGELGLSLEQALAIE
jgi:peptide/nickel transport system substrate-binding protein